MKASLIIVEDSKGNLSVPVIDRDKNAVISMLPEILREGVTAHYLKNPSVRTYRYKGKPQPVAAPVDDFEDDETDPADALSDAPKRRGRPPKA
jgi:hypothetical protein